MKKIGTFILKVSLIFCITLGASFFAFEKIYENLKKPEMQIVLVNEDKGTYFQTQKLSFGNSFVKQVERDTQYDWTVTARGVAENRLANNEADLMVVIPSDFSTKAVAINDVSPEKLSLIYKTNPMSTFLQSTQAETILIELEKNFNKSITEVYFASALQSIDNTKLNVNRIVEEEKAHEAIVVHEINANVTKMTENFTAVKLSSENDTSRLEGLVSSLESFNQRNIKNTEDLANYQGNYAAFEAVYLNNNKSLSRFTGQALNFNTNLQAGEHQTNLTNMSASMAALQNYLTGDSESGNAVLRLEEAKTKVEDSITLLKENREAINNWLKEHGLLDEEVRVLREKIEATKSFPNSNVAAKKIIEDRIKNLCEVENISNVSILANRANDACKKLGYVGKDEYKSSFKGISYFVVDAKDPSMIELSVPEGAIIVADACVTTADAMENFVAKTDSSVDALHCSEWDRDEINDHVLRIKPTVNHEKQQLFAIQYTVTAAVEKADITVNQKLVVEILPAASPIVYVPDTGENVVVRGRGIRDAIIKLTVEETGEEFTGTVDATGNWEILLAGTVLEEEAVLLVHQEVLTSADGGAFSNPSEVVTIKASKNPAPEVNRIKSGENSYITGTGTPSVDGAQVSIVEVTLPSGVVLTSTVDSLGNWKLISPEELEPGNSLKVKQQHEINRVMKTSPTVTKIIVETINPIANAVEAGASPVISGTGESKATIKVYLKDVTAEGVITLSNEPIGEAIVADVDDESLAGVWELVLAEPITLEHGQKLQAIQTDMYGNPAGDVEIEVQDTIAPDLPVVTKADGSEIKGTGEPGVELILTLNQESLTEEPLFVDSAGNWSITLITPTVLLANDKLKVIQRDSAGNVSDSVTITIGTDNYQNKLSVANLVADNVNTVSGKAIPEAKIEVFYNNAAPITTTADLEGKWEVELLPTGIFALNDRVVVKQTTKIPEESTSGVEESTSGVEESTVVVEGSTAVVPDEYVPGIVSYDMIVRKTAEVTTFAAFNTMMSEPEMNHTVTTQKEIILQNEHETIVETTPAVINEYFQLYYGVSVDEILTNSTLVSKEAVEANANINAGTTLYGLLKTELTPIDAITEALLVFKDNINQSLSTMQTKTQTAIDALDGPACVEAACLGGVDDMLRDEIAGIQTQSANLAELQQKYAKFQETFTNLQTESNDVATTLNDFTLDKAEEAPLLFEVTEQHVKMLEQAVSLQENAENYHQNATNMKESAANFAGKTGEMTADSLTYLQGLQQSTITLQENVENNSLFSENLLTVFANSQINGIENNNLYDFMSNPVKKENYSAASYAGMTLFPYFTMIICFILALMMAYSFLNWKRKVEMVYADEYVGDVLKANIQKVVILSVIATIVSIIVGITSAFMAELLGWQLLAWVVTLICIINALTHVMYYLLKQFKSVGLFIILGILLVYLLSSQTLGVYISEGTLFARALSIFPLVYLEKFLFIILYGTSLVGTSSTVIGILVAFIVGIGLSMTTGLAKAKKVAAAEIRSARSN